MKKTFGRARPPGESRTFTPPSSMESDGQVPDIFVIVRSDAGVYAHILDSRPEHGGCKHPPV